MLFENTYILLSFLQTSEQVHIEDTEATEHWVQVGIRN